jgi:glycosyltransferase involved in cell wall biosynthesis
MGGHQRVARRQSAVEGAGSVIFGINALLLRRGLSGERETYLRELVAHLARVDSENDYRLFIGAAGRDLLPAHAPRFRAVVCHLAGSLPRFAAGQLWLAAAARRAGVDVLLCPTASVPRLVSQPTVITVHGPPSFCPELWSTATRGFRRWQSRLRARRCREAMRGSVRRAAALLAVSEPVRREAVRFCGIDPARVVVARHGVARQFRPVEASERIARLLERHRLTVPFVLAVGGLSPYRNLDRMIEGLAQVRRWSFRLPMLALVGEDRFGCRPRLERLAASLDMAEHVRFLGPLPHSDLPALYTAATASLSLSSGDPSCVPMIESMACGCPVICARRSLGPEGVGDATLFVDPDRPQEVAEAIWRLATLSNIRDAWVARGLEHARQFDWHETARLTRDVLGAVAQGRPLPQAQEARRQMPVEAASESGSGRDAGG